MLIDPRSRERCHHLRKAWSLTKEKAAMKRSGVGTIAAVTAFLGALSGSALSAQDKYAVKVPGGLAFSEFRGYEGWQLISISENGPVMAATLGNPTMIQAYKAGFPENGKPWPDGSKMAKVHWVPKKSERSLGATVPSTLHDVDFMVKDSKRFVDSGGWGWGAFEYDSATHTFQPADTTAKPPQRHDAKCGFACHTIVKNRDYVFTDYAGR
jgi:hypothetical protein